MTSVDIKFDKRKLNQISRTFRRWPKTMPKIMKESINATAGKARTNITNRVSQSLKGMRKKDIRDRIKFIRATLNRWQASLIISSTGLPVSRLGMRVGRTKEVYFTASARQSAWLYRNVFVPKYGGAAIHSSHYRIRRKAYPNITYQVMGRTVHVNEPGAFVQTVANPRAGEGARGHKGVFVRKGNRALREIYGPGIAVMLENERVQLEQIEAETMATLGHNIDARVARYLKMIEGRPA